MHGSSTGPLYAPKTKYFIFQIICAFLLSFIFLPLIAFEPAPPPPATMQAATFAENSTQIVPAPDDTAVLTERDTNQRTGLDDHETQLTTNSVTATHFGERVTYPLDGQMYAQPLFVPHLSIKNRLHNVVIAATEHDSVYAFDADQAHPATPLWHTNFLNPQAGVVTPEPADVNDCGDIAPEIGITGTPTIDLASQTLYVVATTKEQGQIVQRLHALDLTTGKERSGSPIQIQATIPGTGDGSDANGNISFDPQTENQRPALLLLNGTVFISWASYCDKGMYHGWILGYNGATLQLQVVYNDTPDGYQGGIWQSGAGLSADDASNLYAITGNGTFNLDQGGQDTSDTVLKLNTQQGLQISDYFTPFNQACLEPNDTDLGSAGPILLPNHEIVTAGKEGRLYVINTDNMGKYTALDDPCDNQSRTDVDAITQELPPSTIAGGLYSTPSYWNGPNGAYLYMSGAFDYLKCFSIDANTGTVKLLSQTKQRFTFPGAGNSISSNGSQPGTGILWVLESNAVLHAYDASNLSHELYDSNQRAKRDGLHSYVKFSTPTIANGEVFVGTKESLVIYGLLQARTR